jgi:AsmA protein
VLELTLAGAAVPGEPAKLRVEAPALTASLAAQSASIEEMQLEMDGVAIRGSMTGTSLFEAPQFAGRIELPTFSPKAVMEKRGMPAVSTADAAALTRAQATARYLVRDGGLELDDLVLTLDDTQLTGTLAVRDFASAFGSQETKSSPAAKASADAPSLRFDLAADRLDLDRYLPPVVKGARSRGSAADPLARLQAALAGRDAEGTLRVGTLEIGDLRSTDAVLGFHAADGAPAAAAEQ